MNIMTRCNQPVAAPLICSYKHSLSWVGVGHPYLLSAHEIACAIGPEKCIALPFLHAFSGYHVLLATERILCENYRKIFDEVTPAQLFVL